jgi:hypothetical protein
LRNGADGADEFVNWRISEKGDYDAEYDQWGFNSMKRFNEGLERAKTIWGDFIEISFWQSGQFTLSCWCLAIYPLKSSLWFQEILARPIQRRSVQSTFRWIEWPFVSVYSELIKSWSEPLALDGWLSISWTYDRRIDLIVWSHEEQLRHLNSESHRQIRPGIPLFNVWSPENPRISRNQIDSRPGRPSWSRAKGLAIIEE